MGKLNDAYKKEKKKEEKARRKYKADILTKFLEGWHKEQNHPNFSPRTEIGFITLADGQATEQMLNSMRFNKKFFKERDKFDVIIGFDIESDNYICLKNNVSGYTFKFTVKDLLKGNKDVIKMFNGYY